MANHAPSDLALLELTLLEIGFALEPGAGVAAAQRVLAQGVVAK